MVSVIQLHQAPGLYLRPGLQ